MNTARIIFLLFFLSPMLTYAETDSRSSVWLMSLSRFDFGANIKAFLDVQPRFTVNDITGGNDGAIDTVLLRGALGYQITPNIGLYQGYAYIPTYDPKRVEHRAFQELLINQALNNTGNYLHRLRVEQRFIDGIDDTSYRFRYFGRFTYPLHDLHEKLSLAINEEVFVHLNDVDSGPQAGFDQNRLFIGLNYRLNPSLAYEVGYQNQYIHRRTNNNISNHILFFGIQTNFSLLD